MSARPISNIRPAAAAPLQPARRLVEDYLFEYREVPIEIAAYVSTTLGKAVTLHPARRNASYKGRVLLDSNGWLIQIIGQSNKTAIAHRTGDIALIGNLQWRRSKRKLHGAAIQVHYNGECAKAYPLGPIAAKPSCGSSRTPQAVGPSK